MSRRVVLALRLPTILAVAALASVSLGLWGGLGWSGTVWGDPPAGQTYVGLKKCASCHFKQYMTWKEDPHAKVFELLPKKYQTDAKCLKCHTTGYGEPTGFKTIQSTPNLAGNTCETCHGPGSKHCTIAEKYGKKKLNDQEEKLVRDSVWLQLPHNVCIDCHKIQAHGQADTPKELIRKK